MRVFAKGKRAVTVRRNSLLKQLKKNGILIECVELHFFL